MWTNSYLLTLGASADIYTKCWMAIEYRSWIQLHVKNKLQLKGSFTACHPKKGKKKNEYVM